MKALSDKAILGAWEASAAAQRSPERALTLLGLALPRVSREELAALPLGRREALLLDIRARTMGDALHAIAQCPACSERLDISISTAEILAGAPPASSISPRGLIEVEGTVVEVRLPDSRDLAALTSAGADDTEKLLLRRCVVRAERGGAPLAPEDLTADVVERIDAWMEEQDPLSSLSLSLRCAACDHAWESALEVTEIFWVEIAARARRLLHEVHTLAQSYGWREADILRMSPARRQGYLDLVGAP